jgi:hypothetical protein
VALTALAGCNKPVPVISGAGIEATYDGLSGPIVVARVEHSRADRDEYCGRDALRALRS